MASPANASALPAPATSATDRRAFLATLAAAGVMTGAAVPAFAADHPDAALLELVAKHHFHEDRRDEFDRLAEMALDRLVSPAIPEALFWRKQDHLSVCFDRKRLAVYVVDGEERHVYEDRRCLGLLAKRVAEIRADPRIAPDGRYVVDRYHELLVAMEEWDAANRRAEDEAGYTEPSLLASGERLIISGLARGIIMTPAVTADGVAAKAEIAVSQYGGTYEAILRRIEGFLENSDYREAISLSLIYDAMKLAASPAASSAQVAA